MKNKKGFTLVELLAVIVILALIIGIAVVGIGNVLSRAKTDTMWENAQSMITGVKKVFTIKGISPVGNAYGFNETFFETGGIKLGDSDIVYANPSGTEITTGLWQLPSVPNDCNDTTKSYISVDNNGVYILCLYVEGAGNQYIYGTQSQISDRDSNALKTNSEDGAQSVSQLSVSNNVVNLAYGTNGDNSYSYGCNGTISCSSSDSSKVTCSVNQTAKKVLLTPVELTTSPVTISLTASGAGSCSGNTSFSVNVNKHQCNAPTNINVSTDGIITWTPSSDCSSEQHQIRINDSSWADASSGDDFLSTLTNSAGEKTIDIRAVPTDAYYSTSNSGTYILNVYGVNLIAGDGVSSVTGAGNYIEGATVTINAAMQDHYIWSEWTGTPAIATQNYSAVINEDWSLTANTTYLCSSTKDTPSCGSYGGCSVACKDGQGGKKTRTCTHKYYSNVSGYTDHLCSSGSNYTETASCTGSSTCLSEWKHVATWTLNAAACNAECPSKCPNNGYKTWRCFDGDPGYPPDKYEHIYGGYQCWCR